MNKIISVFSIVLLVSSIYNPVEAKNYVKIATIGAVAPHFKKSTTPQEMVVGMIEFWAGELQRVLPDKPDLIALPEVCDRPNGLNKKETIDYFEVRKDQILDYLRSATEANHCYIASSTNDFHFTVTTVNLDYRLAHLDFNWAKLRALKKKYGEEVTIYDPGKVGSVMITSEHDDISAEEMIREFDIELLDDYFERSRTFRHIPGNME